MKVLITGATGFLGSHIAAKFASDPNWQIMVTRRNESNLWRTTEFEDKLIWVNTNSENWQNVIIEFKPQYIINVAWGGVDVNGRNNWKTQLKNLVFQQELLDIANTCDIKKFIGVGSQAEYGDFNEIVNEEFPPNPNFAYGVVKLAALDIIKHYCQINDIGWTWFRLFSTFGKYESDNWLIPATIKNMITQQQMNFTKAEQKYSYLHIENVAEVFYNTCNKQTPNGVYNISSKQARPLKEILEYIRNKINPEFQMNFGALPYRANQSMHNQGNVDKLEKYIIKVDDTTFFNDLDNTINYYLNLYK